jgi:hypothetical protein
MCAGGRDRHEQKTGFVKRTHRRQACRTRSRDACGVVVSVSDQFAFPAVWVEGGTVNIPDYLEHEWRSAVHPIQGYFSLPIRLLHALAQTLSFRWLPEIGLWLSVAFIYGVLATIATAPTTLRLPFVCAAAPPS